MVVLPVETRSSAATLSAASGRRAAMVTAAPACDRARTVSIPMPLAPPVTIIVLPVRSTPSRTSAAVVKNPNFVLMRAILTPPFSVLRKDSGAVLYGVVVEYGT